MVPPLLGMRRRPCCCYRGRSTDDGETRQHTVRKGVHNWCRWHASQSLRSAARHCAVRGLGRYECIDDKADDWVVQPSGCRCRVDSTRTRFLSRPRRSPPSAHSRGVWAAVTFSAHCALCRTVCDPAWVGANGVEALTRGLEIPRYRAAAAPAAHILRAPTPHTTHASTAARPGVDRCAATLQRPLEAADGRKRTACRFEPVRSDRTKTYVSHPEHARRRRFRPALTHRACWVDSQSAQVGVYVCGCVWCSRVCVTVH